MSFLIKVLFPILKKNQINFLKVIPLFIYILYNFILCSVPPEREQRKPLNYEVIYDRYLNGDYSGALREIENLESNDPELIELAGNIYYENGNIPEAIHLYNRALNLRKNESISLKLVSCFLYQRKKEEAIRILKTLYENNPGEPQYPFLIGVLYKQINEYRNSMIFLVYALNRGYDPKDDVYNQILSIKNSIQDDRLRVEFQEYFNVAERFNNSNENLQEITRIEIEIGKKNYKRAIEILESVLTKNSENFDLLSILAELYFINYQYNDSYNLYKKLKSLNPDYIGAGTGIVRSLLKLDNPQKAYEEIKILEIKYRDTAEFHSAKSEYYEYKKDYLRAQHEILKIGSSDSLEPDKIIKLADLYMMRSMPEQALILYYKLESKIDKNLYKKKIRLAKSHILVNEFLKFLNSGNLKKAGEYIEKAKEEDLNLKSEFFNAYYLSKIEKLEESSLLFDNIYKKYKYYPSIVLSTQIKNELGKSSEISTNPLKEDLFNLAEFYEFIGEYEKVLKILDFPEYRDYNQQTIVRCTYKLAKRELEKSNLEKVYEYSIKLKNLKAFDEFSELEKKIPIKLFEKDKSKFKNDKSLFNNLNKLKDVFYQSGSPAVLKKIFNIYLDLSEVEKALEFINENQYIKSPEYLETIVDFFSRIGFYSEATSLSIEVNTNFPESAISKIVLGKLSLRENKSNSLDYFQNALDINPTYIPAIIGMGMYYFNNKDYNKAESYFKLVLEQDKFEIEALYSLALIEFERGNQENSEYLVGEVLKINDNYSNALYLKSLILFNKNNLQESKSVIEKLLSSSENLEYLKLYKKILLITNSSIENIEKIEFKIIDKSANYYRNFKNYSLHSTSLKNLVQPAIPPIKIYKNYLIIGKDSICLYEENLKNIIWKNDILKNIKYIKYIGTKEIFLSSLNELFKIDLKNGSINWKIELLENENDDLFVRDFIYYPIKKNNQDMLVYIIDSNGKIYNKLEINNSNKILIDDIGNLYSFFIDGTSLEFQIINIRGEIQVKKTIFLPGKTSILHSITERDSIILFSENSIYSLDSKGSLALNFHRSNLSKYFLTYKNKLYFYSKNKKVYSYDLEASNLTISIDTLPETLQKKAQNPEAMNLEDFSNLLGENTSSLEKIRSGGKAIIKLNVKK